MQRLNSKREVFSTLSVSFAFVDSAAMQEIVWGKRRRFENGPIVGGTVVTCPKFGRSLKGEDCAFFRILSNCSVPYNSGEELARLIDSEQDWLYASPED